MPGDLLECQAFPFYRLNVELETSSLNEGGVELNF